MENKYQLIVIGGGPAGLAAAIAAKENGLQKVLIIERAPRLGGILHQCVHTGFGLTYYQEELTGPEYARRFVERARELGIEHKTSTMVLSIEAGKTVVAVNDTDGLLRLQTQAVVLAMGCRERPRGALPIAGTRPAGVFTAGAAQKMINLGGLHVGNKIVILGSGDVGMILARRLKLEGKEVLALVERQPFVGGLLRNKAQCLDDFGIPLLLSHTVTEVLGKHRVEGVAVCPVDEALKPVCSGKKIISCDTLITSVGLIPETELARELGLAFDEGTGLLAVNEKCQTSLPWVFACGNLLFVHDLVDDVTVESLAVGEAAARFILRGESGKPLSSGTRQAGQKNESRLEADELVCILCPTGCVIKVCGSVDGYSIENHACEKGEEYARSELESPARHITSTVAVNGDPFTRLPVRTSKPVPKEKIMQAMREIRALQVSAPVAYHQALIRGVAGCDADIIASAEFLG
ncbi:MAG: FAD-dependent oxidoreductase [Clostridiales bacterium]|nr:FAD-dependent oxidoreductase [Clostridiales bacterium]